ncbi:putative digestive-organ expansion factor [Erysiphe necator]|uniref:U3 small nucleolar RNA-associated protein 25 n=1 Tax=Uncinula necator TaxID=52586 RepID=A0A0B1P708_UNCNE|nr:putative digestive-organ expansion factor [Erysiphe necator]
MKFDQPRRRAYSERGRSKIGSKPYSHGAQKFGSRSNHFPSRGRGRGRGPGYGRDGSAGERSKSKLELTKIQTMGKRVADEEHDTETDNESTTKSGLNINNDHDFKNDVIHERVIPKTQSYSNLMQNFASESPITKRRKTSHTTFQVQDLSDNKDSTSIDQLDKIDELETTEDPLTENDDFSEDCNEDDGTTNNKLDPFSYHFADSSATNEKEKPDSLTDSHWHTRKLDIPKFGKASVTVPDSDDYKHHPITNVKELVLKKKLAVSFSEQRPELDVVEKSLASFLFNYQDILFCARTPWNSEKLRRLVCLHFLNHILKTRYKVIKNNARIAREEASNDLEFRDQGFTRPKVLIILPTRESCVRFVKMIVSLYEPEQQENRKRFDDMYAKKFSDEFKNKADDFRELFEGNSDDIFRIGLKFTRKTVKYFSEFYNSDIILVSPLGLLTALKGKDGKKGDYDFLSSIEIVIVEQADALLMQNWEHMEYIFDHLNLQPNETHGCDFSRVRNWYLDNKAIYFRQTVTLSAFNTPEINSLLFNKSKNWAGRVKINASYPGVIQELGLKIKQTFSRLDATSFTTDPDNRFTYFNSVIMPALIRHTKQNKGTLIFIPSYLDFVRVRNYFSMSQATKDLSFGSISEYSSIRDVARSRSYFFSGQQSILIYTERAHHFRRYRIRGVRKVIMFGLPENPVFYKEIVEGFLGRSIQEGYLTPEESHVRVIFSKWDALKLERIVGSARAANMMREGETFEFL